MRHPSYLMRWRRNRPGYLKALLYPNKDGGRLK